MKDNTVIIKKEGPVAWVTMNRPESLNSLTVGLCAALKAAFAECEDDNDIRVVVLGGEGKAFCAGGDLRTILELSDYEAAREYVHAAGEITVAVMRSRKPFIAMVGGAAAGAGFNIALACDFVCASKRAKFTQAFSSIGGGAGAGAGDGACRRGRAARRDRRHRCAPRETAAAGARADQKTAERR